MYVNSSVIRYSCMLLNRPSILSSNRKDVKQPICVIYTYDGNKSLRCIRMSTTIFGIFLPDHFIFRLSSCTFPPKIQKVMHKKTDTIRLSL